MMTLRLACAEAVKLANPVRIKSRRPRVGRVMGALSGTVLEVAHSTRRSGAETSASVGKVPASLARKNKKVHQRALRDEGGLRSSSVEVHSMRKRSALLGMRSRLRGAVSQK